MNILLIGVVVYVVAQAAIGLWVSRNVATLSDYVVAGRKLGPVLVTFTVFASFFGAEAIVGTGGAVFDKGLAGAEADPFGYGLALVIVGVVFAAALWRRGLLTFADLFRARYGREIEALVVLVLLPGSVFWAAAQIRAFGHIVGGAAEIPATVAIMLCAVTVVAYSAVGGMLAEAWTDLVQGLAIVLGLLVLAVLVGTNAGGLVTALSKVPAERLAWAPGSDGLLAFVETLAVPICGTIVAVEMVSRILAARSAGTAAGGSVAGGAIYMLVGLLPVYVVLVGAAGIAAPDDSEQAIFAIAERHLPPILMVLFLGAIVSAILSTVSTILLASSAQFSHNLLFRIWPPGGPRRELLLTRLTLVALAVVATALALVADKVKDLVEIASAAGSAGVVVVTVFALFTRFGGPWAAGTTVVVGLAAWVLLGHALGMETPYIAAVALAVVTYVAVGLWEQVAAKTR